LKPPTRWWRWKSEKFGNGSTMVNNGCLLGLMMIIMVNNPTYGGSSHESDS
jgi:hypothetical protein